MMLLAVDAHYTNGNGIAAGVLFQNWPDRYPDTVLHSDCGPVRPYKPGQFYERELPCILQLLSEHDLHPTHIIIDGYVLLGPESRPGLGAHLYESLQRRTPIIGVAKNEFGDGSPELQLYRGQSKKPLFITAIGIDLNSAKQNIAAMHGAYRIPTLLRLVDRASRQTTNWA
tara:strand:+ start:675 stop:1187 length:513 start_codon:yes stop_codon:yes gene_type:complete